MQEVNQVDEVVLVTLPLRSRFPVEEVEDLEVEREPVALHDDVPRMEIAMVLAQAMDAFDSLDQRVQEVEPLEGVEPSAGLPLEEVGEELSLDVLRDQHRNRSAPDEDRFFGVIVDDDRAVTELVELPGVELRRLVAQVAMGEEELRRALDAGAPLSNPVDLALPAAPEPGDDLVLASEGTPGNEIERFDSQSTILPVLLRRLRGANALGRAPNLVPERKGGKGASENQRRERAHAIDGDGGEQKRSP